MPAWGKGVALSAANMLMRQPPADYEGTPHAEPRLNYSSEWWSSNAPGQVEVPTVCPSLAGRLWETRQPGKLRNPANDAIAVGMANPRQLRWWSGLKALPFRGGDRLCRHGRSEEALYESGSARLAERSLAPGGVPRPLAATPAGQGQRRPRGGAAVGPEAAPGTQRATAEKEC